MAEQTNLAQSNAKQTQAAAATKTATETASSQASLLPPVDVIEDAGGITLLADMPGVSKDKLSLQLETDSLTIEGDVAINLPQEMQSTYAEIKVPRYRRTFTLSKDLDGAKATAEFKNGVLQLRIPKAEHAQPRKIQINVG